jgi:NRAMP (natural resistance-associated macrophage protein)-like metal ion transporter
MNIVKRIRNYWYGLGPGLTTGAADDDPSGIGTYSQAGAKYGNQLLWLSPLTFPLMAIIQEMCARIGLVTGRGLANNIRVYFPRWTLYLTAFLLFVANSFNIGADLGAMAKTVQLLLPGMTFWFLVIFFAFLSCFLEIIVPYQKYAKYLKYLALILFVYIISPFAIKDFNWLEVAKKTIIPSLTFTKDQIILICGILGTTISPYLFFWQTSQEVEEKISNQKNEIKIQQKIDDQVLKKLKIDIWSGMFLSNLVMFFIIAVCAATLFPNGINNIELVADAAAALKPLAGPYAYLLFAIGIVGTGLLGIPVLAGSASYAISESLGWREGLNLRFREASSFYGVIILSILVGLGIHFLDINPAKALIYAAVINGLVAPIILIWILILSNNPKIMGKRKNHPVANIFGWLIIILMIVVGFATIISIF